MPKKQIGILAHKTTDHDFAVYCCDSLQTAIKLQDEIREIDPGRFSETSKGIIVTENDIPEIVKEIFGDG